MSQHSCCCCCCWEMADSDRHKYHGLQKQHRTRIAQRYPDIGISRYSTSRRRRDSVAQLLVWLARNLYDRRPSKSEGCFMFQLAPSLRRSLLSVWLTMRIKMAFSLQRSEFQGKVGKSPLWCGDAHRKIA